MSISKRKGAPKDDDRVTIASPCVNHFILVIWPYLCSVLQKLLDVEDLPRVSIAGIIAGHPLIPAGSTVTGPKERR